MIQFRKSGNQLHNTEIYPLNDKFGFIVESSYNNFYRVNLVQLNWLSGEFDVFQYFERQCRFLEILVDKLDLSKFVTKQFQEVLDLFNYQLYKIVNDKIQFYDECQIWPEFYDYSNNKLVDYEHFNRVVSFNA